jgi:hypothetical protein
MSRNLSHYLLILAGVPLLSAMCVAPTSAQQQEWEKSSPYYEDDAWYDISEWLDGNDYNPTDEIAGRWDDEVHDSVVTETDYDDDTYDYDNAYGYNDVDADDDWFYDYYDYDYGYDDGLLDDDYYSYSSRYYDYDDDGFYDAYSSYADTDSDGVYEDYDYYSFNTDFDLDSESATASTDSQSNPSQSAGSANSDSDQRQQAGSQQKDLSSKRLSVTGTIERTKQVKVPKGPVRLVVEVKAENNQNLLVDLGPANQFGTQSSANQQGNRNSQSAGQNANQQAGSNEQGTSNQQATNQQAASGRQAASNQQASSSQQQSSGRNAASQGLQVLKQGEKIVAHGPAVKVGDKKLILAQTVKIGNQDQREILRTGNTVSGTISKMKTAEVRGMNHQLAIVDLDSGKQALVDLGRKENLPTDLAEGVQIQVTGIPTKINNRLVFIANSISKDGDKTQIHRMTASAAKQAATR